MGVRSAIARLGRRQPAARALDAAGVGPQPAPAAPDMFHTQPEPETDHAAIDLERVPEILRPLFAPPPRLTRLSSQQYVHRMVEWMQTLEATSRANRSTRPVYCGWYDLDEITAWFDWFAENHEVEPMQHVVLADRLKSVPGVLYRPKQRLGSEQFAIVAERRKMRGATGERPTIFYIPPPDRSGSYLAPVTPRPLRSEPGTSMVATRHRSGTAAASAKNTVQRPAKPAVSYNQPGLALGDDEFAVGVEIEPRRRAA